MSEENACLYTSVKSQVPRVTRGEWRGTHQECDQQHPDLGLRKGALRSGAVPQFTEAPDRGTEVPNPTEAPRYRLYCTALVAGATLYCITITLKQ